MSYLFYNTGGSQILLANKSRVASLQKNLF